MCRECGLSAAWCTWPGGSGCWGATAVRVAGEMLPRRRSLPLSRSPALVRANIRLTVALNLARNAIRCWLVARLNVLPFMRRVARSAAGWLIVMAAALTVGAVGADNSRRANPNANTAGGIEAKTASGGA
jgi:hypothetical protein